MESQLSPRARRHLERFCRQCLQLQLNLNYPSETYLQNGHFQQHLSERLFTENAIEYAPPQRYQVRVLKELTKRIEQSIQDWEKEGISDDLMNYFASLLTKPIPSELTFAQQKSYVTYTLASLDLEDSQHSRQIPTITLLESRNLVAASGTTGLRTWDASFQLGNYLMCNSDLIKGKRILELGAGTGYISLLCAKYLGAAQVLATDGSDDVVASLDTNFYLNGLQNTSTISGKELRWGQALIGGEYSDWNGGQNIDIVLGADVTYDEAAHSALVGTFGDLFELYPNVKILIAATVRSPKTFEAFLATCNRAKFAVEEIVFEIKPAELQEGPFFSDEVPIQLCMITKSRPGKL